jgi:hypothetical protein
MFGPTTQLEAVNTILATIGEAPVASLSGPLTSDASLALGCLNEITKLVQTDGLPWNTEKNYPLTRDTNGRIYLPSNTAGVEINRRTYSTIEPVMRYNANGLPFLYDRLNQTDVFTVDLVADRLVRWLNWSELPEPARRYIAMRASRLFSDRSVGATTTHQYTEQEVMDAKRAMEASKTDTDEYNILTSPDTINWISRGGPSSPRFF